MLEQSIGDAEMVANALASETLAHALGHMRNNPPAGDETTQNGKAIPWDSFWLVPLQNGHANGNGESALLGMMGVQARTPQAVHEAG